MSRASRRGVLAGLAALAPVTALGAALPGGADAELIRLCRAYIEAVTAYDADGGTTTDREREPFWLAMEAAERTLDGMNATTIAGLAAKAEVALHLAGQPDGSEDFSESFVGDWPEQVVRDLLRMAGGRT